MCYVMRLTECENISTPIRFSDKNKITIVDAYEPYGDYEALDVLFVGNRENVKQPNEFYIEIKFPKSRNMLSNGLYHILESDESYRKALRDYHDITLRTMSQMEHQYYSQAYEPYIDRIHKIFLRSIMDYIMYHPQTRFMANSIAECVIVSYAFI